MTQALYVDDIANLPNGIYIMQMYTELRDRSQSMAVVIHNMLAYPVCLLAGKVIARVMAANEVLATKPSPELLRKLEQEVPAIVESKLTIKQWKELLVDTLVKNGTWDWLKTWPLELAKKAKQLLLEFH